MHAAVGNGKLQKVGGWGIGCFASSTFGGKISLVVLSSQSLLVYIHATHTHGGWGHTHNVILTRLSTVELESPLPHQTIFSLSLSLSLICMDDDLVAYRVRESVCWFGEGVKQGEWLVTGANGDFAIAIVGQAVQLRGSTVYRAR